MMLRCEQTWEIYIAFIDISVKYPVTTGTRCLFRSTLVEVINSDEKGTKYVISTVKKDIFYYTFFESFVVVILSFKNCNRSD